MTSPVSVRWAWCASPVAFVRLLAVTLLISSASIAQAQEVAKILMLGDSGLHKPSEFFRHLKGPLAENGVQLQYTESIGDINADNLANFKGLLVFANIERIAPETESALLTYVENGGALIPVHSGSFCFLNSDKYIQLVGGQFRSHGFTKFETKIVAPEHEIMKGLQPISSEDESYRHSKHNKDRVVLETRSDASGPVSDPAGEPYTWIRESGKGRVFYTAWGHDFRTWQNVGFQKLLAHGIRWACRLPVDTAVTGSTAIGNAVAVKQANRPFPTVEMTKPDVANSVFKFTDVGAKIPNYTPGERWGTQGALITSMQNPIPADQSIKSYSTPKGFHLSIWARESNEYWPEGGQAESTNAGLKGKPIAMNWDERGRLWICETIDYPNELQTPGQGRDRIKICEDTDNDGQADKFTIFAEHLSIPSTLVCYRGGVIVQDGQTTTYLKDIDGDDVADFRQTLITGWAMGDTHGGVSNFQYGPDNWIWAMQGYNNSEPVINGKPQARFRQGFWRYKVDAGASDSTAPAYAIDKQSHETSKDATNSFDKHTIRVAALEFIRATNNNTWGLGFSEEGYVFGSTANGCPSVHMPIPNRYYDQVAGWSPKTLERISASNNFVATKGEVVRQVDYHGGYTAGAGSALYTARNYPSDWWNKIQMVCEPTAHLVGGFVIEKSGAGYRSNNTFNTVVSVDDWAAPIMSEVGPDGNVWVLDWYNYIVQHNPTPNGFRTGKGAAYESDLRDKRFARIYRLLYDSGSSDRAASRTTKLSDASNGQLVETLKDKNFFWRRTAQRLLVERAATDLETLDALVALVDNPEMDDIGLTPSAMHAIWTLAGLADSESDNAKKALWAACNKGFKHISSPVRNAAVAFCSPDQLKQAIDSKLQEDADPKVQLSVLLRLADNESPKAIGREDLATMVTDKAKSIVTDDILLDAWTSASSTRPVDSLIAVLKRNPSGREIVARISVLAEHLARSSPTASDIEQLLDVDPNSPLTIALWEGMAKGWSKDLVVKLPDTVQQKFRDRFLAETTSIESKAAVLAIADKWSIDGLSEVVGGIQEKLLTVALNPNENADKRLVAWDQAIRLAPGSEKIVKAVGELFTAQLAPEVGTKALDSLQAARAPGLSQELLSLRGKLGPKMAGSILTLLLARADTTEELLNAIAEGKIQFSDLQLDQRQAILNHPNRDLANRASELMKAQGALVSTNRQGLVDDWMPVTRTQGNLENGIAMYKKHCALCHRHGDLGVNIGPNLTGMAVHPKEEILVNVLDPSRSVENNFRTYQILTNEGAVLTGMLAGESANSMRLINSQGKEEQVLREDIDEMNSSTKSLMPEGFETLMSKAEMTDLLTFLNNRGRYTPLSLVGATTVSGAQGLPGFRGGPGDKFLLSSYGKKEVEGVPFELEDPQEGRVANIVALQGRRGRAPATLPQSTSVPCSGKVSSIHLLAALATFGGPPNQAQSSSLIVRCHFNDGTTEDHELSNGKQLATYREKVDVPESKFAIDANGKQIRYLKIEVDSKKDLKSIEFVKGEDFSIPLVFAVTVESTSSDAH